MGKLFAVFVALAGCSTEQPMPDAGTSDVRHHHDARQLDGATDGAVDASIDAGCWMHHYYACGSEVLDICVPYVGCATFTCNGVAMGYCGPG